MKTSVNLYRRSQEKQFSKDKDVQGEKELEMDTSVCLEGSSKDVITKRSDCMFQTKGVVHKQTLSNTCYAHKSHVLFSNS